MSYDGPKIQRKLLKKNQFLELLFSSIQFLKIESIILHKNQFKDQLIWTKIYIALTYTITIYI